MANHLAIQSFSQALTDLLSQSYAAHNSRPDLPKLPAVQFDLLSSGKFSSEDALADVVTLYLHRVSINNHLRNLRHGSPIGPLSLDLHFLLTVWSAEAATEHALLGWCMQQIHFHPYLNRGSLSDDAGWAMDDTVNVVPAELASEEMARIWEASGRGYRLSYPFIARIVRIDLAASPEAAPVVARRLSFADPPAEAIP
jgi:hypothetical protein